MILKLGFQDRDIVIDLIDKPVIRRWFDYFKIRSDIYKFRGRQQFVATPCPLEDSLPHWQDILGSVKMLERMGYQFPRTLPDEFDGSQETLNYLHRFFTYNTRWFIDNQQPKANQAPHSNPFDPNFRLPPNMDYKDWHGIIDVINQAVHKLEEFVRPHANQQFVMTSFPIQSLMFAPGREDDTSCNSCCLEFTPEEQEANYTYMDYEGVSVMLDREILGKCVLQSFCENDDLMSRDCTGRLGSFGGFVIDLNDNRKKLYQRPEFQRWIAGYNRPLHSLPIEFAIGHVRDYQDHLPYLKQKQDNIYNKFIGIEFLD